MICAYNLLNDDELYSHNHDVAFDLGFIHLGIWMVLILLYLKGPIMLFFVRLTRLQAIQRRLGFFFFYGKNTLHSNSRNLDYIMGTCVLN